MDPQIVIRLVHFIPRFSTVLKGRFFSELIIADSSLRCCHGSQFGDCYHRAAAERTNI
jgi:hypothetical protein